MKGLQGTVVVSCCGTRALGDKPHGSSMSEDRPETHGWRWCGPSMLLEALSAMWLATCPTYGPSPKDIMSCFVA